MKEQGLLCLDPLWRLLKRAWKKWYLHWRPGFWTCDKRRLRNQTSWGFHPPLMMSFSTDSLRLATVPWHLSFESSWISFTNWKGVKRRNLKRWECSSGLRLRGLRFEVISRNCERGSWRSSRMYSEWSVRADQYTSVRPPTVHARVKPSLLSNLLSPLFLLSREEWVRTVSQFLSHVTDCSQEASGFLCVREFPASLGVFVQ